MRSAADGAPSFVYLPALASEPDEVTIGGDEAHYLRRVVRIRPGETVTASDGAGTLAELVVLDAGAGIRAEVRSRRAVARATALEVWCGAPEGDRADWLVEKLAELGAATLRFVDTERGRWERAEQRAARWDRLTVAALRQSRSAHRLAILPPAPLAEALAGAWPVGPSLVADAAGGPYLPGAAGEMKAVRIAIGPSGGFSDGERKLLVSKGFIATRLSSSRLRTETAAIVLAALVLALPGTPRPA